MRRDECEEARNQVSRVQREYGAKRLFRAQREERPSGARIRSKATPERSEKNVRAEREYVAKRLPSAARRKFEQSENYVSLNAASIPLRAFRRIREDSAAGILPSGARVKCLQRNEQKVRAAREERPSGERRKRLRAAREECPREAREITRR